MIETEMRRNFYCYSCTNATEKCYRKEIGCPCGKYKSYKDENVELKAHCKAVDEVNEEMKCCGNCGFAIHSRLDGTFCDREAEYRQANEKCNKWEKAE